MNIFTSTILAALFLVSCVSNRDRQLTPAESRYVDRSTEIFTLRFAYNACKAHLAGQPTAAMCQEITKLPGEKTKTLAL